MREVPYYYLKLTNFSSLERAKTKKRRFWSLVLILMGLILISNVAFPFFLYEVRRTRFRTTVSLVDYQTQVLGQASNRDYRDPRYWFTAPPSFPPRPTKITHYTLSIPALGIKQAVVQIGGKDLMKALIHYPGTALPGQYGNAVVFGHSVLPQFFNPKNYKTIFSTLPKLKKGDEILINFDGINYRYQVIEMIETSPEDVSVLEQRYDAEYLTLITCVPPGTYLRRLVVRAQLVRLK